MRRVNIQAAFLGEGGDSDTGDEEGLALSVRGGAIVLVLPAGTSEAHAVQPVCEGGLVIGVVSEADLIGKSGATVGDVMTSPAVTVAENTSLEHVAEQLTQQRIRRLPVVDADGRLVGVVSRRDVLRWAASRVPAVSG